MLILLLLGGRRESRAVPALQNSTRNSFPENWAFLSFFSPTRYPYLLNNWYFVFSFFCKEYKFYGMHLVCFRIFVSIGCYCHNMCNRIVTFQERYLWPIFGEIDVLRNEWRGGEPSPPRLLSARVENQPQFKAKLSISFPKILFPKNLVAISAIWLDLFWWITTWKKGHVAYLF